MPDRLIVTAAEFARNIGHWQEQALSHPVSITRHGRERLVLSSSDRFAQTQDGKDRKTDESVAALKALLSNMGEGFIAFDAEWRIVRVNRLTESYFGLSSAEILGRRAGEIIRGLDGSFLFEQFNRVGRTREPATFETESLAFPGRYLQFHAFPYLDGIACVWMNKTEERHLKQNAVRADAMAAAARVHKGIATAHLDSRGRFVWICDSFTEWTGFTADQLLGVIASNIVDAGDRVKLAAAFGAAIESGGVQEITAQIVAKNGEECVLDMALSPLEAGANETGVCIIATKAAAEARERSARRTSGAKR
ncbi:MAG: PAS domain-containing protein [Hyphomonadaceae bacterium]